MTIFFSSQTNIMKQNANSTIMEIEMCFPFVFMKSCNTQIIRGLTFLHIQSTHSILARFTKNKSSTYL